MKLKRNTTPDGMCKYSLIEHEKDDHVEHGLPGTANEFFVLKLKDIHAKAALLAYAESVAASYAQGSQEYADDVIELANRSGINSPWCKFPD